MLGEYDIQATIAVKDINKGKEFYGQTLGLKQLSENSSGVQYSSGNGRVFVYQSDTAGTGQASCASWAVDDVKATVEALKAKGISFEHYTDLPGVTMDGDVHLMGPMQAAWFKDPDGNVLRVGGKM